MGISNYTLKRIFNETKDTLIGGKIERIILIGDNDFLLTVFKDGKLYNLLLSLNPSLPIFVLSNSFKVNSINHSNYQCNLLKKYLTLLIILAKYSCNPQPSRLKSPSLALELSPASLVGWVATRGSLHQ